MDDAESQKLQTKLWNGELSEAEEATYVAFLSGSHLPIVMTVYRESAPSGDSRYHSEVHGLNPVGAYLKWCAVASFFAALFVEVVDLRESKKRAAQQR